MSIGLRISPEELAAIDRVRGLMPRGSWIKQLCRDAVLAHDALRPVGPDPNPEPEIAASVEAAGEAMVEMASAAVRRTEGLAARPMVGQPRPIVGKR